MLNYFTWTLLCLKCICVLDYMKLKEIPTLVGRPLKKKVQVKHIPALQCFNYFFFWGWIPCFSTCYVLGCTYIYIYIFLAINVRSATRILSVIRLDVFTQLFSCWFIYQGYGRKFIIFVTNLPKKKKKSYHSIGNIMKNYIN